MSVCPTERPYITGSYSTHHQLLQRGCKVLQNKTMYPMNISEKATERCQNTPTSSRANSNEGKVNQASVWLQLREIQGEIKRLCVAPVLVKWGWPDTG